MFPQGVILDGADHPEYLVIDVIPRSEATLRTGKDVSRLVNGSKAKQQGSPWKAWRSLSLERWTHSYLFVLPI